MTQPTPPKADLSSGGAVRIALIYAGAASLWILLSDRAMGLVFSDSVTLVTASIAKGWLFVAGTSLLLYVLVSRLVSQLDGAHRREMLEGEEKQRALQLLEAVANSSGDAIFAKDEAGRYLLVNDAAARYMGLPIQALLGQDDRVAFTSEQASRLMDMDRRVFTSGRTEFAEELLQTAQGERVFLATKGPLRDTQGRIFGTFGISRDITDRKRAEDELAARNAELERFNRASVGRELDMIALKQRVNALSGELGRPAPFALDFLRDEEIRT